MNQLVKYLSFDCWYQRGYIGAIQLLHNTPKGRGQAIIKLAYRKGWGGLPHTVNQQATLILGFLLILKYSKKSYLSSFLELKYPDKPYWFTVPRGVGDGIRQNITYLIQNFIQNVILNQGKVDIHRFQIDMSSI